MPSTEVDLAIEIAHPDFCAFITGLQDLRNSALPPQVVGRLGWLSALHERVARPDWIRSASRDPEGISALHLALGVREL